MDIKWRDSKLAKKMFFLALVFYLIFTIVVYFVIYFGIPVFYNYYNKAQLEQQVNMLIKRSTTFEELQENIRDLQENRNVIIDYEYNNQFYECNYQYNGCHLRNYESDYSLDNRDDFIIVSKKLLVNRQPLNIKFISPLSSTEDVQRILVLFLPIFAGLSILLAFLISLGTSLRFSRGILILNRNARKISNLDFDIKNTFKSDDELGELSSSLVVLATRLNITLTELKAANAKLNDDFNREKQKEEERRAYIAALSHDLKTPLTAIKGQLEGMIYNVGKYKDHDKYLKNNLFLVNEMEGIIQSILVSSKLDDYDLAINKTEVDLQKIINNILSDNEYLILDKNLTIQDSYDKTVYIVDLNLFKTALSNIINNAIIYADNDSTVMISITNNQLIVSNKIEEFDEEILKTNKLLKPFYRADKSRNKKGSGLGLYISSKIFEKHNMTLSFNYEDHRFIAKIDLK